LVRGAMNRLILSILLFVIAIGVGVAGGLWALHKRTDALTATDHQKWLGHHSVKGILLQNNSTSRDEKNAYSLKPSYGR
jgi:hypothetical protein